MGIWEFRRHNVVKEANMITVPRERITEMIDILKRLDVRGFESNDLLIALVRYLQGLMQQETEKEKKG